MSVGEILLSELSQRSRPLKAVEGMKLLGVAEAAERLGVSRQAVHKAIASGALQSYRIVADHNPGKLLAVLVTAESVDQYERLRAVTGRSTA